MSIHSRPMLPRDVRGCVEIIAAHPTVGPRYAGMIENLRKAWLQCLGSEAFQGCVFEEVIGSCTRLLGAGVRAFVSDEFVREIKSPPFFWVGPELARRTAEGNSPLLSNTEVRRANSSGGLNLVFWGACMVYADSHRPELLAENGEAIIANHRGFLIKEWIMQADTLDVLQVMAFAGGCTANQADGGYVPIAPEEIPALFVRPHVIGLTKELALERMGSWASNIFIYEPPRFYLRPSEQTLLLAAMRGHSDEELADELGISRSAVKKTWRSIYERVATCDANLLPQMPVESDNFIARGKAKRHHLLSYLREHMQELRPVSRRLRRGAARHGDRELSEQRQGINVLAPSVDGDIRAANLRRT